MNVEIKYDGVDLMSVAPIKIDDIVVSPVRFAQTTRGRSIQYGTEFVRNRAESRTVTITFALLKDNYEEREEILQAIRDWAKTDKERNLMLPQFDDRHLECVCTKHPDTSFRKWWESKLQLIFTCYSNPFWTSNNIVSVKCGTEFAVGGSAPPVMTIENSSVTAIQNQSFSNGTESMLFTTIPAGKMVIDLNRQTAAIGTASFMKYFVPTTKFLVPKIGAGQIITGVGYVNYRERWV